MLKGFLLLISASLSLAFTVNMIYGKDNRVEIESLKDVQLIGISKAIVGLAKSSDLTQLENGQYKLFTENYGKRSRLCPEEPFGEQPMGVFCSGFLIDKDVVVTAGHCISEATCMETRFIFGFAMHDGVAKDYFSVDQAYSCKRVIKRMREDNGADYAVVQLDKHTEGIEPLKISSDGVSVGDEVFMYGHPMGIPMKFADEGIVRSIFGDKYFVASTDSYGGNSGSAILNAKTLEVEGILVRGDTDLNYDKKRKCYISNICAQDRCRGEDITLIGNVFN